MKIARRVVLSYFLIFLIFSQTTATGSTAFHFHTSSSKWLAKSFDSELPHGQILLNPRGLRKSGFSTSKNESSPEWTAKYGSVTFNQHGQDLPLGGINEKGLVVESLTLIEKEAFESNQSSTLNELQWIQYQLDNFQGLKEIVAHINEVGVSPIAFHFHYLACDADGGCGVFEFKDRKLVSQPTAKAPLFTVSNLLFQKTVTTLIQYQGFGGKKSIPWFPTSEENRFIRAADEVRKFQPGNEETEIDQVFSSLKKLFWWETQWNTVYSPVERKVFFRTRRHWEAKFLQLESLSFDCERGVRFIPMTDWEVEDVTPYFFPFKTPNNEYLVEHGFENSQTPISQADLDELIEHPGSYRCANKRE